MCVFEVEKAVDFPYRGCGKPCWVDIHKVMNRVIHIVIHMFSRFASTAFTTFSSGKMNGKAKPKGIPYYIIRCMRLI
jgi:hypothetical protein